MLQWKTIKDKNNFSPFKRFDWYSATLSAQVDMSEYGCTGRSYVSIRFSIHPRRGNDCHSECNPYMLLAQGNRIYLRTIDEGKAIAESIAKKMLEQLNCTKEQHGH